MSKKSAHLIRKDHVIVLMGKQYRVLDTSEVEDEVLGQAIEIRADGTTIRRSRKAKIEII